MSKETPTKWLQVIAKRDGFRRAGFSFSETATIIDPSKLEEGQIEALKKEKMLVVTEVDAPSSKEDAKAK